jgi:hypothetical protein
MTIRDLPASAGIEDLSAPTLKTPGEFPATSAPAVTRLFFRKSLRSIVLASRAPRTHRDSTFRVERAPGNTGVIIKIAGFFSPTQAPHPPILNNFISPPGKIKVNRGAIKKPPPH